MLNFNLGKHSRTLHRSGVQAKTNIKWLVKTIGASDYEGGDEVCSSLIFRCRLFGEVFLSGSRVYGPEISEMMLLW